MTCFVGDARLVADEDTLVGVAGAERAGVLGAPLLVVLTLVSPRTGVARLAAFWGECEAGRDCTPGAWGLPGATFPTNCVIRCSTSELRTPGRRARIWRARERASHASPQHRFTRTWGCRAPRDSMPRGRFGRNQLYLDTSSGFFHSDHQ
jgi:hypothetical protein